MRRERVIPVVSIVALLALWELVCRLELIPAFLLPAPSQVLAVLIADAPLIASHALTTIIEALLGLGIGVVLGFILAVLMERFEFIYLAFEPIMTISQTIPTVAIAPLLVLWFGYGLAPKIILIVITTFFPVTISLVSGFRSVDPDQIDLLKTMRASDAQIFFHAKVPAAAEQFFSGLRISATYAIVGAVIAEWLGGFSGLGVYMTRVRKSFSYDRTFASIIVVSALSIFLMRLVDAAEYLLIVWKRPRLRGQKERNKE